MNGPVNDDDLTSTLKRRADDFARLGGSDLDLAQVMDRAGEIRRGRRMRASMMMAAVVLAVAVPVGIVALDNGPGQVSPAPDPTETPTLVQPNHDPISLDGLKPGDPPKYGYAFGETLHYADTDIPLGKGGEVRGLARIDGGFLVARSDDQGSRTVTFVGDDGSSPDQSWPIGDGGFAVSPEGSVGAFVEPDGTVVAVQDAGTRNYEIARITDGSSLMAGAVLGEDCSGRSEDAQCVVFVNQKDENTRVWAVSHSEGAARAATKLMSVNDAHGVDLAGIESVNESGSACSAVESMDSGAQLWSSCETQLQSFSPDGKYVLGVQAYGDGLGDSELMVFGAADGAKVLDLKVVDGVTIYSLAWEDDASVLALVGQGSRFEVIRFALDGNRRLALGPKNGVDDLTPAFQLPGS